MFVIVFDFPGDLLFVRRFNSDDLGIISFVCNGKKQADIFVITVKGEISQTQLRFIRINTFEIDVE